MVLLIISMTGCESNNSNEENPQNLPIEIIGISPESAPANSLVTINGTNFNPDISNQITVGGTTVDIVSITPNQIVFRVPIALSSGIVVLNVNGTEYSGPQFTYQQSWQVSTFAGTNISGFADGLLNDARFSSPNKMTIDSNDNIYVIDGNRIRKITPDGIVTTVAGNGNSGTMDGPALDVPLTLYGITVNENDEVIFSDQNCLKKLSGGFVTTIAGNPNETGLTDGMGLSARLAPTSLTHDPTGNIYFIQFYVAFGDHPRCVRKLAPNGYVSTITTSTLIASLPRGITYAPDGFLYMTNEWSFTILKINPQSGSTTIFAGQTDVSSCNDGQGTSATFGYPYGIAANAQNELFFINNGCTSIDKISSTGYVSAFANAFIPGATSNPNYHTGVNGYADGLAWTAQFYQPTYLDVASNGDIFISDTGNHCIRRIRFE